MRNVDPVDLGGFWAVIPDGWQVGEDEGLTAVYPPDGDAYVAMSTFRGPADHHPSAAELWDFAVDSIDLSWGVTAADIRVDVNGYALDAEGPVATDEMVGEALYGFRLWPSRLVFASFIYAPVGRQYVPAVKNLFASLGPSRDISKR